MQENKTRKKLSVQLMVATLCCSFLIAIAVSAIQIYLAYTQGVQNAQERFVQIEKGYVPSLVSGLWEVNKARIDTTLDSIADLPDVGSIELTDELGTKWGRHPAQEAHIIGEKVFVLTYKEGNFVYPSGELKVALVNTDILARITERALAISITSVTTLLLGSLVVLIIFQQGVARHLRKMARFAENLDLNNLNDPLVLTRKKSKKSDELDVVVDSINHMQKTLKADLALREQIEQELRGHKNNLELLVQQRTVALEAKTYMLEAQSLELEAQNRELDAYAHSVAHDLKTPLTTLIGISGLLTSASLSPEQSKKFIDTIHRTATKMNSIIEALLLLASVRRADEISPEILDMKKIAQEACTRLADFAQRHGAEITFVGDWRNAFGHEQWVEEVWVNYLSNAIKYGGAPPKIELGAELIDNNQMKFWVSDYGDGIKLARRPELFVQFSRLDPHVSDGHGLGLSIVKRIINRLHGDVGYEESANGGSCFWFTLPAAKDTSPNPS